MEYFDQYGRLDGIERAAKELIEAVRNAKAKQPVIFSDAAFCNEPSYKKGFFFAQTPEEHEQRLKLALSVMRQWC